MTRANATIKTCLPGMGAAYGFPTNVVTDWAAREAEKRPPETEMGEPAASFELVVVTYGVTDAGQAVPATKNDTFAAPPPFTTTMLTVPSDRLLKATTRGVVPDAFGALLTSMR